MDFTRNYFELFGLQPGFEVDSEVLALRYRDLQRAVHPDRFANASDQERRLSVQQASLINEAFQTLKAPLARARYLLEISGYPLDDTNTAMDPEFLMEQMELREALSEVKSAKDPFAALDRIRNQLDLRERRLIEGLSVLFADGSPSALGGARENVRKMQFIQRLSQEAADLEEDLVHQHE